MNPCFNSKKFNFLYPILIKIFFCVKTQKSAVRNITLSSIVDSVLHISVWITEPEHQKWFEEEKGGFSLMYFKIFKAPRSLDQISFKM